MPYDPTDPEVAKQFRDWYDVDTTRQAIFDGVANSISKRYPFKNDAYSLELADLNYKKNKPFTIADQKNAILNQRNVDWPLYGTWRLRDNKTNQVVSEVKNKVVARVPYLTPRGTFIFRGNEYVLANQARLRPGIYARKKENGELEAHANLLPGTGRSFRVHMEPATGVFKVQLGQGNIPAYPILKALGATDEDMAASWGEDLYKVNADKFRDFDLAKVYTRFADQSVLKKHTNPVEGLRAIFDKMEIDPEVSTHNLGKPYKKIDNEVLLRTMQKLLNIQKEKEDEDDRDSQANQIFMTAEDLFSERIAKDAGNLGRSLLWKISRTKDANKIPSGYLTKQIYSTLLSSGLASAITEVNPIEITDQLLRVSRMGVGAITCYSADTEVLTRTGWKRWPDVCDDDLLACLIDNKIEFHKPERLYKYHFEGELYRGSTRFIDYLVTDNHRMYVSFATTTSGHQHKYSEYQFREAAAIHGKKVKHKTACAGWFGGSSPAVFVIPPAEKTGSNRANSKTTDTVVCFEDWVRFLGYYLADGHTCWNTARREFKVEIAKVKRVNPEEWALIDQLLAKLGFKYRYDEKRNRFVITGKHIAVITKQFGTSSKKFVPDYIMNGDFRTRQIFVDALTTMDHNTKIDGFIKYQSASNLLVDQVSWLATSIGKSTWRNYNKYPQLIINDKEEQGVSLQKEKTQYSRESYVGTVYCAKVLGGLVYVRRNGKPLWCGNSLDAVPDEARNVHPSQLGMIDIIRAPECWRDYDEVMTSTGWKRWYEVDDNTLFACRIDGKLEFHKAKKIYKQFYDGPMVSIKNYGVQIYVTPNHRMWVRFPKDKYYKFCDAIELLKKQTFNLCLTHEPYMGGDECIGFISNKYNTSVIPPALDISFDSRNSFVRQLSHTKQTLATGIVEERMVPRTYEHAKINEFIAFTVGRAVSFRAVNHGRYELGLIQSEKLVSPTQKNANYKLETYRGVVCCAEVPGNLLFCRGDCSNIGFWCGNSLKIGVDQRLARGTLKGPNNQIYRKVKTPEGKDVIVSAVDMVNSVVAFPGEDLSQPHVRALVDGQPKYVPTKSVQYVLPTGNDMFTLTSNLVPGISGIKGGRLLMGAKFITQALALQNPEAPLVRAALPEQEDRSFEEDAGRFVGAIRAKQPGTVLKVTPDEIHVKYKDGTKGVIELYNNFVFNQKSTLHNTPVVQPGDKFDADQLLAKSNYTDDKGTTAIGLNLRVGWMPYRGNYEDGITISESAAKKLASEHMYSKKLDSDPSITVDRKNFLVTYPGAYTKDQLTKVDENGVVKPGTVVQYGDPLILAVKKSEPPANMAILKQRQSWYSDASEQWDSEFPGLVTDVSKTPTGIKVAVKSYQPAQVGDKLCFTPDHDVLTDSGWKPITDLTLNDKVCSIDPDTHVISYVEPSAIHTYEHDGDMLGIETEHVSTLVTPEHKLFVCVPGSNNYRLTAIKHLIGSKFCLCAIDKETGKLLPVLVESAVQTSKYTGKVYCPELPYNHTLYVRRNGKCHFSGNSTRFGGKGIVSSLIPDDQMPRDSEDRPLEILYNPQGIITRTNPTTLAEVVLAKIARKTGKPYNLPAFSNQSLVDFALSELKKHNINETETVYDPGTNRKIPDILTGEMFMMKLHHTVESKSQARDVGLYSLDNTPAAGKEGAAKRQGYLEMNALLAHNALPVLKDIKLIRGQKNDEFWRNFRMGLPAQMPKESFIYKKFLHMLQGAGVNTKKDKDSVQLLAMTDRAVDKLAENRELTNGDALNIKDMSPISGGLFDNTLTGGLGGNRWSKITLPIKVPSPILEPNIRHLLDLTGPAFEKMIKSPGGLEEMSKKLSDIDVDKEIEKQKEVIKSGKASKRDLAVKKLRILDTAKRTGIHPRDFMISKIPVLPPVFRPVAKMRGMELTSDANLLYKDLHEAVTTYKDLANEVDDVGEERATLYNAVKAVTGLGDPVNVKNKEKNVGGLLQHIFGKSSPKFGLFQRKILSSTVDTVGRTVITPDNNLDMDSVGIPEAVAWDLYRPFIMRRLARRYNSGEQRVPLTMLANWVADKDPRAKQAMLDEMKERPVLISRAPVLHKYGIMAQWPKLTPGHTMRMSPILTAPFGADYNGDSCRTDLLFVRVDGKIESHTFETFLNVYLPDGYKESEAIERFGKQTTIYTFEKGRVQVLGLNTQNVPEFVDASHISVHTSHGPTCYFVRPRRSLGTIFTAHHNFWKLNDNCELVAVKTGEVKVGDLIPCAKGFNFPENPNITLDSPAKIPLTFETGLWFGHWLGDGSITGRWDTISHASTDSKLLTYLEDIMKDVIDVRPWREGNGISTRWTSVKWVNWIAKEFSHSAEHKKLPDWAFNAPEPFKKGLLAGFTLAEGSVKTNSGVRIEVVNKLMLMQFKALFESFDAVCTLGPGKKAKGNNQATFVLYVANNTFKQLNLPLPDCQKSEQFNAIKLTKRQHWDRVPINKTIIDICISQGRLMAGNGGRAYREKMNTGVKTPHYNIITNAKRLGYVPRSAAYKLIAGYALRQIIDSHPAIRNWIAIVENNQLCWDVIDEITVCERPDVTYDFTVPGKEAFAYDGTYLTHNSMNFHVPVSQEAVQSAVEKMLPSKNLINTGDFRLTYVPRQEYLMGLWMASRKAADKPARKFKDKKAVMEALVAGTIGLNDPVEIVE